jgi:hypothetical protein
MRSTSDPAPDFGPDVKVFEPGAPVSEINAYLQEISREEEFSERRHAVLFKPGTYGSATGRDDPATAAGIVNSEVGYYTSIAGLGEHPTDVTINGALHVEPRQKEDGTSDGLTNFYRSLANLTINPIQRPVGADAERERPEGVAPAGTMRWATSQASSLRRVDVQGDLDLNGAYGATVFGAVIADSRVSGQVSSGGDRGPGQAQYFTRDSQIGAWTGGSANLVFSGVAGAPDGDFHGRGITSLASTAVSRPAPYLTFAGGRYEVVVPSARTDSSGVTWDTTADDARLPIDTFHIAGPDHDAATINAALADGRNLLLTPGIYALDAPLRVTRPGTVVLGLGFATLAPADGQAAIEVDDVTDVVLAGLVVDAGLDAGVVVRIGTGERLEAGDPARPTTLSDVFVRIGGSRAGSATTALQIDQSHVFVDNAWLWRADHGTGVGWDQNPCDHGLVVNGDDVTALGLFVEHHQRQQTLWNGERGATVFYQSELPYDPPDQASWTDGTKDGYASYVVAPSVTTHDLTGTAICSLFTSSTFAGAPVHATTSIEAPMLPTVRLDAMTTAVIALGGGIRHVVNGAGDPVDATLPNNVVPGFASSARMASAAG